MTITAFEYDGELKKDEMDVIVKSILFLLNNDEVKVEENGTNGIGWFNFSYRVQNSDNKNAYKFSINSVTTTVTNALPTSCTCNAYVPIDHDKSNDQSLVESSIATTVAYFLLASSTCIASVPVDNSTDQPLAVFSSSLWALIAVAIMLLLALLVTIVIAICIVRNMSMKLNEIINAKYTIFMPCVLYT